MTRRPGFGFAEKTAPFATARQRPLTVALHQALPEPSLALVDVFEKATAPFQITPLHVALHMMVEKPKPPSLIRFTKQPFNLIEKNSDLPVKKIYSPLYGPQKTSIMGTRPRRRRVRGGRGGQLIRHPSKGDCPDVPSSLRLLFSSRTDRAFQ